MPLGFDYSLRIDAPPGRVVAAFFHPKALAHWWDVANLVATPRPLGVYALEWVTSPDKDDLLGRYGGILHGTVVDYQPRRGFLVAECYWLPPDTEPVGPMAIEVTCSPAAPRPDREAGEASTLLRVVQRGVDESSPRWIRYYELLAAGWPPALDKLKTYLEQGQGIWDLRGCE